MGVKFYHIPASGPCRSVHMCARTLGVDIETIVVDIFAGEQMKPDFLKMNPQHQVPVLVDGDLIVTESRAMLQYLGSAYGKESFYPKDPKARAMVDQRLFFEATTLYGAFENAYYVIFREKKLPEESKLQKLDETLGYLELFLSKTAFVASDNLTVADFAFLSTLSTIEAVGHDLSKFPKIKTYMAKTTTLIKDYEETNGKGVKIFGNFVENTRKEITA